MKNILLTISKVIFALLIGIFITLLLLEISLRIFGWWEVNGHFFRRPMAKNKNEIVILALGESVTVTGGKDSYPAQLETILNNQKFSKRIKVINGGVVHTNSSDILFNLEDNLSKFNPDIVLVMTGTNDFGSVLYDTVSGVKYDSVFDSIKIVKLFKFLKTLIYSKYFNDFKVYSIRDFFLNKIGDIYIKNDRRLEALKYFEEAIKVNPKNDFAYQMLGFNGYVKYTREQRMNFCKKAIAINPNNDQNYFCLGELYFYFKAYDKQIELYKSVLNKRPDDSVFIFEIAKYYFRNKEYAEAEKYLISALSKKDNYAIKNKMLDMLKSIYEKEDNVEKINELNKKILDASRRTDINLNKIYAILKKKSIPLVLVQYPLRDVDVLKMYIPQANHVYFVDNKETFEKAVELYGYDKLFIDAFAGDFGHGTSFGNNIIAKNIAEVIVGQVFKNEKIN